MKSMYVTTRVEPEKRLILDSIINNANKNGEQIKASDMFRALIDEVIENATLQKKVLKKAKARTEKAIELVCPNCGTRQSEGKFKADMGTAGAGNIYPVDLITYIQCGNCGTRFDLSEEYKQQERLRHDLAKLREAISSRGVEVVE